MVHLGRAAERLVVPASFSDVLVNKPEDDLDGPANELPISPVTESVPLADAEKVRSQQLESIRAEVDAAFENTTTGDSL